MYSIKYTLHSVQYMYYTYIGYTVHPKPTKVPGGGVCHFKRGQASVDILYFNTQHQEAQTEITILYSRHNIHITQFNKQGKNAKL